MFGNNNDSHDESLSQEKPEKSSDKREKPEKKEYIKNIVLFVVGAAAIVLGSQLMVNIGSEIAARLGVPDRIIAVTLIAVGTSLPELVTTIT
ncbi:MAG: sodium:calcium antiporter, partial [Ruminococcus sp.]|nr:sodium:calcium antiporter [Ruminococcus sp.]